MAHTVLVIRAYCPVNGPGFYVVSATNPVVDGRIWFAPNRTIRILPDWRVGSLEEQDAVRWALNEIQEHPQRFLEKQ